LDCAVREVDDDAYGNRFWLRILHCCDGRRALTRVFAALAPSLSHSGAFWPIDDRVMWLQMISMAFQMAYGQKEAIKITKEAVN
jgi:hypothetical protein